MSHEAALHNHEDHGHDDHGHHEHHDTFLTKYVFSQDHKMIAKQFLITGMVWAVLGWFNERTIPLAIRLSRFKFSLVRIYLR